MSVNTSLHVWERKREMIEIPFILITNFETAGKTGLSFLSTTILCLFFKSGEEFLLKVRLKYLPIAHSKYFFCLFVLL